MVTNKEAYIMIKDALPTEELKAMFNKFIMMGVVAIEFLESIGLEVEYRERLRHFLQERYTLDLEVSEE